MTRPFTITGIEISEAVRKIRRHLGILTEDEARLAYIDEATDRIDLELRMRDLDRSHRSFSSFPDKTWTL